jgi:hypothetical protein
MNANAEFATVAREWEAREALQAKAASIYPHSQSLQREWLRAMETVRSTSRGYVLDTKVARIEVQHAS